MVWSNDKILNSLGFRTYAEKPKFLKQVRRFRIYYWQNKNGIFNHIIKEKRDNYKITKLCEVKTKADIKIRKLTKIIGKKVTSFPGFLLWATLLQKFRNK